MTSYNTVHSTKRVHDAMRVALPSVYTRTDSSVRCLCVRLCRNVGNNVFSWLPASGLQRLLHLKAHNNPYLRHFHPPELFPRIQVRSRVTDGQQQKFLR